MKELTYYIIGVTDEGDETTLMQGRGAYEFHVLYNLANERPNCDVLLDEATINGLLDKLRAQMKKDGVCEVDMISFLDRSPYAMQLRTEELYLGLVQIKESLMFGGKYYLNVRWYE